MASENTSRTFDTEAEAKAFMLGYSCGQEEEIECSIDPQEPRTILVDFGSTYGVFEYLEILDDARQQGLI